jgi:hypothetical protein
LENKRTSFLYRDHGDFEYLISASTVPLQRDPIDPLSVLERVVAFGIGFIDCLPRRQKKDLRKILVFREPHVQLALVQRFDVIEHAQGIEDAALKEDWTWICSVMSKVLYVCLQHFLRELIWIRAGTQPAPLAILNDGAGGISDDRVTTSLQSYQERGLP